MVVVLATLAAGARVGHADPERDDLVKKANDAYQRGDRQSASLLYEEAYGLDSDPELLHAAAAISFEANDCPRVIDLLDRFLDLQPPPKGRKRAGEMFAECESRLAANEQATRRAELAGRLRGALDARDCERARDLMPAWIDTAPDEPAVATLQRELDGCTPPDPEPLTATSGPSRRRRSLVQRPALLGTIAVGGVLSGAGSALLWLGDRSARGANGANEAGDPIDEVRTQIDVAERRRTQGGWLVAAGAATALAAYAVHLLVPSWQQADVRVEVEATDGGGSMQLTAKF